MAIPHTSIADFRERRVTVLDDNEQARSRESSARYTSVAEEFERSMMIITIAPVATGTISEDGHTKETRASPPQQRA
jgi:hypothetical protein